MRHLDTLRSVLTSPRASREQIVAMQERRLRQLIWHAYDHVPFYRALMDRHRVKPHDIQTLADLPRLPIVTKSEMAAAPPHALRARDADPRTLVERRTSGSSGPIFTMVRSQAEELVSEMLQLRIRRYFGLRVGDTQVVAVMDTRTLKAVSRMHRLANRFGVHRTVMLSPLLPPEEFARKLAALRPQVILGLAGPIARLAGSMTDELRVQIRPKHVITTGEVLTARMRRAIAEGFAAPVYDKYVCAELGHIAWECVETGELHTCDDHLIIEVVRDGAPANAGERGELVATGLNYHAMPFIRYKLADVVTRGQDVCACGQPFSTIRAVQGRMIDYFHLPDGRLIHPYEIGGAMQHAVGWVKEFQLIQERRDLILANIVPTAMPSAEEVARAKMGPARLFGDQVEVRIAFVDRIDWGTTGKLRLFRSHVRSEYDDIDWEAVSAATGG
jgi:phenylacetate-CoA ligase